MRVNSTTNTPQISRRTSIQALLFFVSQGLRANSLNGHAGGMPAATLLSPTHGAMNGLLATRNLPVLPAGAGVFIPRHAQTPFFAGIAPFQGVTHFDNAFSATTNIIPTTATAATASDLGDPTLYPMAGLLATGWDFSVTASAGNVSGSITAAGANAGDAADFCVRLNRKLAGETVQTVSVKTNDSSLVKLLSVYLKLNLVPNNPTTLADITITGYKAGSPLPLAVKTVSGIHTVTWTLFDVSSIPAFTGVDEFRFTTQSITAGAIISSVFIDEITLPITPLPLTLVDFSGHRDNNNVLLNWTTASEQNTRVFEVQRATDGASYTALGEVPAAGNSSTPQHYDFTDTASPVNVVGNFYRLKMIDLDGKYTFSPVLRIATATTVLSMSAYPNPFSQQCSVYVEAPDAGKATITIRDMGGRTMLTKDLTVQRGSNVLSIPSIGQLEKGIYLLTLTAGTKHQSLSIVKSN